ncbi:MAG TPA: hypothetical protein PKY82_00815 [Pyrinomonadaceae bacterium]|nr:hypothetical protein [Pyrinomonadaceae bacterium]
MIAYTKNRINDWHGLSLSAQNRNVIILDVQTDKQFKRLKSLLLKRDIHSAFYEDNGQLGLWYDLEDNIEPEDFFNDLEKIFDD